MRQIEIKDHAKQELSVVIDSRRVTFLVWYSSVTNRWSFDLSLDGEPILTGRRIVVGVDMLAAFNLGIGAIFALTDASLTDPNRDALPEGSVKIFHATQDEIDAAVAS